MNRVILAGRLTKDPEIGNREKEGKELTYARFTLAVTEHYGQVEFIPCVSFRKNAEFAEKYFRKGMRVLVEGRIHWESFVNDEGVTVWSCQVIIQNQEFADGKKDDSFTGNVTESEEAAAEKDAFMEVSEDALADMPFS